MRDSPRGHHTPGRLITATQCSIHLCCRSALARNRGQLSDRSQQSSSLLHVNGRYQPVTPIPALRSGQAGPPAAPIAAQQSILRTNLNYPQQGPQNSRASKKLPWTTGHPQLSPAPGRREPSRAYQPGYSLPRHQPLPLHVRKERDLSLPPCARRMRPGPHSWSSTAFVRLSVPAPCTSILSKPHHSRTGGTVSPTAAGLSRSCSSKTTPNSDVRRSACAGMCM